MNNAEKFKQLFGIYATELWAMPEEKFLEWLNAEALEKQEQDRWRSVAKEGNPKENGAYNCTCSDGTPLKKVSTVKFHKRTGTWELTGARAYWKVVAWRPLPEPYTEEEA